MTNTKGIGTNTGHGHVWIRPDGVRMRCGGPAICSECAKDAARWGSEQSERNTAPEEKWLEVDSHIDIARVSEDPLIAVANLSAALRYLYELLEPPSVRERRMNGG